MLKATPKTSLLGMLSLLLLAVITLPRNVAAAVGNTGTKHYVDDPSLQATSRGVEEHHSLRRPLDESQVYWKYGGSTVGSRNRMQLTPRASKARGFLLNDYPMDSDDFEIYTRVDVHKKTHHPVGGEGMALFILDPDHKTFPTAAAFAYGPLMGLPIPFKGVGVVFDGEYVVFLFFSSSRRLMGRPRASVSCLIVSHVRSSGAVSFCSSLSFYFLSYTKPTNTKPTLI
jgi:hypothetical protein